MADVALTEVATGEAALAELRGNSFDLAILDLNLPGIPRPGAAAPYPGRLCQI